MFGQKSCRISTNRVTLRLDIAPSMTRKATKESVLAHNAAAAADGHFDITPECLCTQGFPSVIK